MKRTVFVISHTHWDREWYLPFQEFRMRLVDMVDRMLDLLTENPRFKYFMLDGQTSLLDDYLEIRPERLPLLASLVRQGRIAIGPWYTLADEFLVSGEALIRNLMAGERAVAAVGPVMPIAYLPDTFGHISQLPQIAVGYGLKAVLITRGVPDAPCEFLWDAPDGVPSLAINLRLSYGNAAYFQPNAGLPTRARDLAQDLAAHATTPYLLFMNGMDHATAEETLPESIHQVNETLEDVQLVHGTLDQFVDAVLSSKPKLEHLTGEMRDHKMHFLLPGVLSSRMWIKQNNASCQRLLERWAEPFSAWASRVGSPDRRPLLRQAWRYLLQNHAHDSICGCSVDAVHDDMKRRFVWVDQIGSRILSESLSAITERALSDVGEEALRLFVFNSESAPRTDVVVTTIESPSVRAGIALEDEHSGRITPVEILDQRQQSPFSFVADSRVVRLLLGEMAKARLVDKCILDMSMRREGQSVFLDFDVGSSGKPHGDKLAAFVSRVAELASNPQDLVFHFSMRYRPMLRVRFVAEDVPAIGYRAWKLVTSSPSLAVHRGAEIHKISNEFLEVTADPKTGVLKVVDRETGKVFTGLNRFSDGGDAGDEYNYCPPLKSDCLVTTLSPAPRITVKQSQVAQELTIRQSMNLPVALTKDRQTRSARSKTLSIDSTVTLCRGVKRIDIETRVINRVRDHRLRVHFPTGVHATRAWADSAFDVLSRPVGAPPSQPDWKEQPVASWPLQHFVDVHDEDGGLMVATDGLPEYEVEELEGGCVIAITLLRCVGWLSRGDLFTRQGNAGPAVATPGAQCLGEHRFRYSLIPHRGSWENALKEAHGFASPMRAQVAWGCAPKSGTGSLVSVQPETVIVSAMKRPESGEGLLVRLYNPLTRDVSVRMNVESPFTSATRVNLREDPSSEPGQSPQLELLTGGQLAFDLPAKRIQSILFR